MVGRSRTATRWGCAHRGTGAPDCKPGCGLQEATGLWDRLPRGQTLGQLPPGLAPHHLIL